MISRALLGLNPLDSSISEPEGPQRGSTLSPPPVQCQPVDKHPDKQQPSAWTPQNDTLNTSQGGLSTVGHRMARSTSLTWTEVCHLHAHPVS